MSETKSPYIQVLVRFGGGTPYLNPISGYVASHVPDSKLEI